MVSVNLLALGQLPRRQKMKYSGTCHPQSGASSIRAGKWGFPLSQHPDNEEFPAKFSFGKGREENGMKGSLCRHVPVCHGMISLLQLAGTETARPFCHVNELQTPDVNPDSVQDFEVRWKSKFPHSPAPSLFPSEIHGQDELWDLSQTPCPQSSSVRTKV